MSKLLFNEILENNPEVLNEGFFDNLFGNSLTSVEYIPMYEELKVIRKRFIEGIKKSRLKDCSSCKKIEGLFPQIYYLGKKDQRCTINYSPFPTFNLSNEASSGKMSINNLVKYLYSAIDYALEDSLYFSGNLFANDIEAKECIIIFFLKDDYCLYDTNSDKQEKLNFFSDEIIEFYESEGKKLVQLLKQYELGNYINWDLSCKEKFTFQNKYGQKQVALSITKKFDENQLKRLTKSDLMNPFFMWKNLDYYSYEKILKNTPYRLSFFSTNFDCFYALITRTNVKILDI